MGNTDSTDDSANKQRKHINKNQIILSPSSDGIPFNNFCGSSENQETLKNTEKNEIVLTTTYSYPKGTYNAESVRLFSHKEKLLFYFISTNNISALRYLIINGVNINILDEDRTSPLHIACRRASVQMVEEIINQGAMINIPDIVGWTPLHIACYSLRPEVILLLLKRKANFNTMNRDKKTPRDLIENRSKICLDIIDNFEKYEKGQIERCINGMNSNGVLYEDVVKKYLTYQKLRGEYLSTHEDILDEDIIEGFEEINKRMKEEKRKESAKSFKIGEYKSKRIERVKEYIISLGIEIKQNEKVNDDSSDLDEVPNEFSSVDNTNNEEIKKRRRALDEILSTYKYIPKRHCFYHNYHISNNTIEIEHKNTNTLSLSINNPSSFMIRPSIQTLNENKEDNKDEEIYELYESDSEESDSSDIDKNNSIMSDSLEENDKTISMEGKSIRTFLTSNDVDENVLPNEVYRSINIEDTNYMVKYFDKKIQIFEGILLKLFHFDFFISFLFLISISQIENSLLSLITYISNKFTNKELITLILSKNQISNKSILDIYFKSYFDSSFSYSQLLSQICKIFMLSISDLKLIDDIAKSFASSYYTQSNKYFKSEHSLYCLTFSVLVSSLLYSEEKKEKTICDLVILTKDLNDGDNYNRKIIKECIEMISKLKIENAKKEINIENNKMNNVAIVVNGKYKTYYAIYNDGLFIMYKSQRGSIDSFMYVKMKEELIVEVKGNTITIERKEKNERITIVKNRNKSIKYKYVEKVMIIIENSFVIQDLVTYYKN